MGAFGAHALKKTLESRGTLQSWQTAVQYQLITAVALLALDDEAHGTAKSLLLCGAVAFSGSIYGLSLGGPRLLGPVTPLGGLAMIAGWAALA